MFHTPLPGVLLYQSYSGKHGKDIWAWGGGELFSGLVTARLVAKRGGDGQRAWLSSIAPGLTTTGPNTGGAKRWCVAAS